MLPWLCFFGHSIDLLFLVKAKGKQPQTFSLAIEAAKLEITEYKSIDDSLKEKYFMHKRGDDKLVGKIIEYAFLIILFTIFYFLGLIAFSVTLRDDIEIYSGKSTSKKWSREKNLFRKYLFLDYRQHIIWWHYVLLWVYIVIAGTNTV